MSRRRPKNRHWKKNREAFTQTYCVCGHLRGEHFIGRGVCEHPKGSDYCVCAKFVLQPATDLAMAVAWLNREAAVAPCTSSKLNTRNR